MRLTPLNILSSVILVASAYLFLNRDPNGWRLLGLVPLLAVFVLCFVADLFFRRALMDLKRIWIIESLFIIFVLTAMIVFKILS